MKNIVIPHKDDYDKISSNLLNFLYAGISKCAQCACSSCKDTGLELCDFEQLGHNKPPVHACSMCSCPSSCKADKLSHDIWDS